MHRSKTKTVYVGGVPIGGGNPVTIQSMTNTKTSDAAATINQILALEEAGCEIVRVAVPDKAAAEALLEIKKNIHIPLVADIHFDWRLALMSLDAGVDKLRINPGNIGDRERVKQVVDKARERGIPIRIGVNGGSMEKGLLDHGPEGSAEAMAASALSHIRILEELDFGDIIISMKSSSVPQTVKAYEILSTQVEYPLHVGITETGSLFSGVVKSAAGIGAVLSTGVGDTIRVSLTGDVIEEIRYGKEILKAIELRIFGPTVISCPTCGRTSISLAPLAARIEQAVGHIKTPIRISVMGCAVNGPGEARKADIGVTGGNGCGAIYRLGKFVKTVPEDMLFEETMREIDRYCQELSGKVGNLCPGK